MGNVTVISLGGSLIAPAGVNTAYLAEFKKLAEEHLIRDENRKLILVCGGGALCRDYQKAYRELMGNARDEDMDWIGIAATHLNGELVRRLFRQWCVEDLITDPTAVSVFAGRVMVAAGWKPGFSTDNDAVILSNIAKVYTDDPKKNPAAKPLDSVSWAGFMKIIGDEWIPGKNTPFDPTAARAAAESRIRVIFADGRDIGNLKSILEGGAFVGTTIGPD
jgi:uridylate kinase